MVSCIPLQTPPVVLFGHTIVVVSFGRYEAKPLLARHDGLVHEYCSSEVHQIWRLYLDVDEDARLVITAVVLIVSQSSDFFRHTTNEN